MAYEAHLDRGALRAQAKGSFEGLDPSQLSGRPQLEGVVNGTLDANVQIADVTAPVTLDAISGGGTIHLTTSNVGGFNFNRADLQATYASQIADVARCRSRDRICRRQRPAGSHSIGRRRRT